jgi:hypothetical protein
VFVDSGWLVGLCRITITMAWMGVKFPSVVILYSLLHNNFDYLQVRIVVVGRKVRRRRENTH